MHWVAEFPWTGWQLSCGLRGNFAVDWVATFLRTGWQNSVEYAGFGSRELARIILHTLAHRIHHHTVQQLWQELPPAAPPPLPLLDSHRYAERSQARMEGIALSAQGWSKRSISQFLQVSRPTIHTWIARFEADNLESVEDKSRAPPTTVRKAGLPVMVAISHWHKRHPDAGGFRLWSLRGTSALAVRTVERIMAIHRRVYKDIPGTGRRRSPQAAPQPHPFKATAAHAYWCIDGRMMDFALEGHRWWSLIILDGSSRTMLAGAVAPLGSQLGGADGALYRVSALRGARTQDCGQRRRLQLRGLCRGLYASGH